MECSEALYRVQPHHRLAIGVAYKLCTKLLVGAMCDDAYVHINKRVLKTESLASSMLLLLLLLKMMMMVMTF